METATGLLTQAREAVLRENRIKFNQSMIETVFEPGEIVRFFNHMRFTGWEKRMRLQVSSNTGTESMRSCRNKEQSTSRGNSTKTPRPRMDPAERPTDPGRRGKEGSKGGIKKEPNA